MDRPEQYSAFRFVGEAPATQIVEQDGGRTLVGYAVVWGAVSDLRADGFRHRFNRGSILWAPTVHALWAHSYASPLASTANKSLVIGEDDTGVRVEIKLDDTTDGENTLKRVRSGLVAGMSFGGRRIGFTRAEGNVIDITRFVATEVSVLPNPSMAETVISAGDQAVEKMRAAQARTTKNKLDTIRLAMLRPA
ncbi:MAG TPA: HK97 family phage prohead protease [Tepidisphaeraceae bacterium]|jgi:HK97 family phage prohead protease